MADAQHELMVDRVMGQPLALNLLRVVSEAPFQGTMSELLDALGGYWDNKDRYRPTTPAHLSTQLTRIRPVAERADLFIELLPRTREGRGVRVWKEGQDLTECYERGGVMKALAQSRDAGDARVAHPRLFDWKK
jgi:hypothetical protein